MLAAGEVPVFEHSGQFECGTGLILGKFAAVKVFRIEAQSCAVEVGGGGRGRQRGEIVRNVQIGPNTASCSRQSCNDRVISARGPDSRPSIQCRSEHLMKLLGRARPAASQRAECDAVYWPRPIVEFPVGGISPIDEAGCDHSHLVTGPHKRISLFHEPRIRGEMARGDQTDMIAHDGHVKTLAAAVRRASRRRSPPRRH
jgi:hypothetical protein